MKDLLASRSKAVLRELARPGTVVVLDFDGTLAPIVSDPRAARLSSATRRVLERASRCLRVAILTGRSIADVRERLDGIPVEWIIGNHGAEWPGGPPQPDVRRQVDGWCRTVARRLAGLDGVEVEDKHLSLSIHWRRAKNPHGAAVAALRAALGLAGAAVIPGKKVLNVVPASGGDKGTALRRLVEESDCARSVFIGDDVTDEAAFREPLPNSITVRVGRSKGSAAEYYLARRADVDRVLAALVALRTAPAERSGGR